MGCIVKPNINRDELIDALSEERTWLLNVRIESTDVRLVYWRENSSWIVRTGDVACGASEIGNDYLRIDLEELADDLISQVEDQIADTDNAGADGGAL